MRENNKIISIWGYISTCILCAQTVFGGQLNRTSGPYDLDNDGRKEVLIISSSDRKAVLVEFQDKSISDTLWSYTLPKGTYFTDVSVIDIDSNGQPDLIATSKISIESKSTGWLYVFQGTTHGFSESPLVAGKSGLDMDNIRPLNLSKVKGMPGYLSVSFGTPVRKTLIIRPNITDGHLKIDNVRTLSDPLIQNGFGHMYSGGFSSGNNDYVAQFSAELSTLKVSIFNVKNNFKRVTTEIVGMGKSRGIIGAEVQPYSNLKKGEQGLLIPFRTGEVKILNIIGKKISLTDSEFSHEDLFLEMKDPNKSEILDLVSSRIESGFYNKVITKNDYIKEAKNKRAGYRQKNIEGPTLVDYLNEAGIVKKSKIDDKVEIPKKSDDMNSKIWAAKASVKTEQVDSTLLISKDLVIVNPIPDEDKEIAFHKTIFGPSDSISTSNTWEDTVRNALVPEPIDLSGDDEFSDRSIDLYYVMVMAPSKGEKDRYVFDGEAPFGINVNQVPPMGEPTHFQHSVSANISYLRRGNDYDFAYTLKEQMSDSVTTLTMVHDMQTNIIFMSISPGVDSISQSYQPEAFDPKLFEFPDYFFEGFPTSLGMDFKDKIIKFSFDDTGDSVNYQGLYLSATTPSKPSQSLAVFLNEGILQAIRGEIKVRENGSKKITTEFDITGYLEPSAMFSRLIQEEFSDSLKTNLLQGTYLEEPLFGPNGKLPKVIHERRLPEEQFDQQNPNIPVEPLKGIYPEGQGVISNSKAKTEVPAPGPQNPIDQPASTDSETINDGGIDNLNLESIKTVPETEKNDNILNNVNSGNNLPETINTGADSSGLIP
ncbi:MAG: VCBS repeat-containing protein [Candidatus Neomarinimicrobiota bacterium]|nr:VCBS repeat-containing protein [Candidatus Neomarinimicrobiota bacterium]